MKPLTPKQAKVFRFLSSYFAANQRMPTFREICVHMGFRSPNAAMCHLRPLRDKGYIFWEKAKGNKKCKSRCFEITGLSKVIGKAVAAHVRELIAKGK